jgi:hypothetical protein
MTGRPKRAVKRLTERLKDQPEFFDRLFTCIAGGGNMPDYCKVEGIPYSTVYDAIKADPALSERLQAARDQKVDWHIAQIEQVTEAVTRGEIDPKSASVSIASRQWLASKMNPRAWGERQQVDVAVTHTHQLHLDAIRALSARREAKRLSKVEATMITAHGVSQRVEAHLEGYDE